MKNRILVLFFLCLGIAGSQAALTMLADPATSSASTSFAGDIPGWGPQRLYDAAPTPADLETLFAAGTAQQYAGAGTGPHVIVFDYGATVSFNGLAYSQRAGADPTLDKVQNIDVWVTNSDPGAASLALPGALGAPDANTGALLTADTTFRNYDLGTTLSGRWVVFQFNDAGGAVGNPGGSELQLTIPEPSGSVLGAGAGLLLLLRRKRH